MTKAEATSLIDAVDVGEVNINLTGGNLNGQQFNMMIATVKYALITSTNGVRVGSGTCASWSERTQEKVRELLASMEADICLSVFGKDPQQVDGAPSIDPHSDGVPQL